MSRPNYHDLESLYGAINAELVMDRVSALLSEWQPRLPPFGKRREGLRVSERDAILITYADQVRAPGEPPLRVLRDFCKCHLKGWISGIHLLPFYPWSSDDGFSVKDFFAVDPTYGTWDDVSRLGLDFELMFDGVFNHASAQGEWFQKFLADDSSYRDFFISVAGEPDLSSVVRPRALPLLTEFQTTNGSKKVWTTFSADQVDLNYRNPEVLLRILEALLLYVSKRAGLIRLDAIAFLWKEIGTSCLHLAQTHHFVRFLRAVLDEVAPSVLLITETNVPHSDNLTYFGDGTNEAQLVYNFALPPLVLHSFVSGNAGKLSKWARSLTLPSDKVTFLNFLASHDGIGLNPARRLLSEREIDDLVRRTLDHGGLISYKSAPGGAQVPYELNINYLDALSNPQGKEPAEVAARKFLTAHAILFSLRGVPAVYFHSLFGSRGDRMAAETSGIPRRINRAKCDQTDLEKELRQPATLCSIVHCGQRELLRVRSQHPAFAPSASQQVIECDARLFAVLRRNELEHDTVLCLHNLSGDSIAVPLWAFSPAGRRWKAAWGSIPEFSNANSIELAPYNSVWLTLI